jgi:hypothetical protein
MRRIKYRPRPRARTRPREPTDTRNLTPDTINEVSGQDSKIRRPEASCQQPESSGPF